MSADYLADEIFLSIPAKNEFKEYGWLSQNQLFVAFQNYADVYSFEEAQNGKRHFWNTRTNVSDDLDFWAEFQEDRIHRDPVSGDFLYFTGLDSKIRLMNSELQDRFTIGDVGGVSTISRGGNGWLMGNFLGDLFTIDSEDKTLRLTEAFENPVLRVWGLEKGWLTLVGDTEKELFMLYLNDGGSKKLIYQSEDVIEVKVTEDLRFFFFPMRIPTNFGMTLAKSF